ncbi:MAG: antitoxin MazE-like protein [Candidatus Binataceae bacterium]
MKLLRVWVPDPNAKGFREAVRLQAARLRSAPEEAEALRFIEAATEWPED